MSGTSGESTTITEKEIVIERVFDAPRELVWKAWTEPERVMRWWGPNGYTSPAAKIDLRVGGTYLHCMRSRDGQDYWSTGTFREIVPLERIVATDSFADENGNVVSATHYGMSADIPLELQLTVTFEEQDGKTTLTLRSVYPTAEDRRKHEEMGVVAGWNQSLDKLAESLRN